MIFKNTYKNIHKKKFPPFSPTQNFPAHTMAICSNNESIMDMVIVPFAINVMGFLLEAGQQVFFWTKPTTKPNLSPTNLQLAFSF
jgi:hypothetical protein